MIFGSLAIGLAMAAVQPPPLSSDERTFDPVPRPMEVEIGRDRLTDGIQAFAVARTWNGRLTIGCDETRYHGIRVTVSGRNWLRGETYFSPRLLLYHRFDNAPAQRRSWMAHDRSAYLHPRSHVLPFLSWMVASKRLTVRMKDIEDRTSDLVFPIAGSRQAIDRVLNACGAQRLRGDLSQPQLRQRPPSRRPWWRIF